MILFLAAAISEAAVAAAAGPTSRYVLSAGYVSTSSFCIVQGAGVVTNWTANFPLEDPVVVLDTIRTTGGTPGLSGAEFTLAGVPTGVTFTNGMASEAAFDAATDGTFIYVVDWSAGDVIRLDLTYSNPQVLFSLNAASSYLGITYDPTNTSLWIASWASGTIADHSMTGSLLSSFSVPYSYLTCLALDPSDGTLWFAASRPWGRSTSTPRPGSRSVPRPTRLWSTSSRGGESSRPPSANARSLRSGTPASVLCCGCWPVGASLRCAVSPERKARPRRLAVLGVSGGAAVSMLVFERVGRRRPRLTSLTLRARLKVTKSFAALLRTLAFDLSDGSTFLGY